MKDMGSGFEEGDGRAIVSTVASGAARGVVIRRAAALAGPAGRPWGATGSIDVEALCIWAYRDQRVDRYQTAGLYSVEAEADGYVWLGRSADGCAAIADIAHMGCRVQSSGVSIRNNVHPAAEAVDAALASIEGGRMVAHHARQAGRPDGWSPPARWFRPVMWVKPGVEAAWEHADGGARYCPIITVASADDVERCRAGYALWWNALDQLAWRLSMRALGFVVLRPAAPREPWVEAA